SLFAAVDRPNVMVKVPRTGRGAQGPRGASQPKGVSMHVTLLFSVERYSEVADAYVRGLERRLSSGLPVGQHIECGEGFS
ncbi:MAG: transaldolase, partial [Thermoleophilia bacterium]|nr:transaldolase [Thermoleophilia bacterium]